MFHRPLAARGRLMSLFLAATFGALVPVLTDQGPRLVNPRRPRNPKLNFSPRSGHRSGRVYRANGAKECARRVRQMQTGKCIDPIAQRTYLEANF